MKLRLSLILLASVAGMVACTTNEVVTARAENLPETRDLPLGAVCKADAQCLAGLTCKLYMDAGNTCSDTRICTVTCKNDTACKAVDTTGKCLAGCGDELICVPTSVEATTTETRKTEDLPLGARCLGTNECTTGLKCLKGAGDADTCDDHPTCTVSCKKDADCTTLDASAKCLAGCNGKTTCFLTAEQ